MKTHCIKTTALFERNREFETHRTNAKINQQNYKKSPWHKLVELEGHHGIIADWRDFPQSLLEATTMRAEYIPCLEGYNCSMSVIIDGDGEYIGICMDEDEKCDRRELNLEATVIYRLNNNLLLNLIAGTIGCQTQIESIEHYYKLWKLGYIIPRSDCRLPVFVYLGNESHGVENVMSNLILQNYHPFLLVTPLHLCITYAAHDAAERTKSKLIGLDDLLEITNNELTSIDYGTNLIARWINDLVLENQKSCIAYRFPTPMSATWEQIVIEFTAREVINVRCGNTQKRLEPEHLGMKSQKTGRPTNQWILLQALAMSAGRLSWKDENSKRNIKKQKQELINKLKYTFQIPDDPIVWDKKRNCYQCKFVIHVAQNSILSARY